jgi:hypothetical protein
MFCVDMIVEGGAGRAVRLGRHHLADGFADQWVIDLHESRMFFEGNAPTLRSQLTLIVAPVEVLAPGGDLSPVPAGPKPTHGIVLALPRHRWVVEHLDAGETMQVEPHPVGYFEGNLSDPAAARLASHTVAACIARGEVPVGSRNAASAFAAASAAAFRAADLVTVIRFERKGGDGADAADTA